MKKYISLFLLLLSALCINAQIYTIRQKIDKFDDIEFENIEKTLITCNFSESDSTITFEVKGHEPMTYYVYDSEINGTRTSEINLVDDIFGCEEVYGASMIDFRDTIGMDVIESNEKIIEALTPKNTVIITHRTVSAYSFKKSTSNEFPYKTDLWWIRFTDGSRLVYLKD